MRQHHYDEVKKTYADYFVIIVLNNFQCCIEAGHIGFPR